MPRSSPPPSSAVLGALPAVVVLLAELVQWRASRWGRPATAPVDGPQVVLVLGSTSRPGGRPHPVQRWRTEIAVRSMHPVHGRLLFTGGSTGDPDGPSEARVMATWAREVLGVPAERIALEEEARSTWENVARCTGELEGTASVVVASTPTHAARARRYLAQQRPDLARRLAPADDYRVLERSGWKVVTLAYEAVRWCALRARR